MDEVVYVTLVNLARITHQATFNVALIHILEFATYKVSDNIILYTFKYKGV